MLYGWCMCYVCVFVILFCKFDGVCGGCWVCSVVLCCVVCFVILGCVDWYNCGFVVVVLYYGVVVVLLWLFDFVMM